MQTGSYLLPECLPKKAGLDSPIREPTGAVPMKPKISSSIAGSFLAALLKQGGHHVGVPYMGELWSSSSFG